MINSIAVSVTDYEGLLSKFPEQYREKLRVYTGEELFYAYKLCTYKVKRNKDGELKGSDILYLALKAKTFRWLKGEEKYGVHPSAWEKLGSKFRGQFYGFVEAEIEAA